MMNLEQVQSDAKSIQRGLQSGLQFRVHVRADSGMITAVSDLFGSTYIHSEYSLEIASIYHLFRANMASTSDSLINVFCRITARVPVSVVNEVIAQSGIKRTIPRGGFWYECFVD